MKLNEIYTGLVNMHVRAGADGAVGSHEKSWLLLKATVRNILLSGDGPVTLRLANDLKCPCDFNLQ